MDWETPRAAQPQKRRFLKIAGIGALFAGLGAGAGWKAHAHGRGFMHGGAMEPERLERMLKHLYVEIEATEAQKQKLAPIVKDALGDLSPLHEKAHQARRRGVELLSAPSVDRNALEALRAEQIQAADAASKRLARALADAAEVLTPEQKKALAGRLEKHRGRWQRS